MENITFYKESEEYKAIKRLEEMTKNYSLNSEDLHYANILYYLIINLQKENEALKKINEQLCKELNTSNMSEEEWLDYAINYNLEQLEKDRK